MTIWHYIYTNMRYETFAQLNNVYCFSQSNEKQLLEMSKVWNKTKESLAFKRVMDTETNCVQVLSYLLDSHKPTQQYKHWLLSVCLNYKTPNSFKRLKMHLYFVELNVKQLTRKHLSIIDNKMISMSMIYTVFQLMFQFFENKEVPMRFVCFRCNRTIKHYESVCWW